MAPLESITTSASAAVSSKRSKCSIRQSNSSRAGMPAAGETKSAPPSKASPPSGIAALDPRAGPKIWLAMPRKIASASSSERGSSLIGRGGIWLSGVMNSASRLLRRLAQDIEGRLDSRIRGPNKTRTQSLFRFDAKHRRMVGLERPARAQIHVDSARQAWIETADRAENVDAFEVVDAVFLEERGVLHRVFVGARHTVGIARTGVPTSWRIRMIIRDLAIANHHMVRQDAAHRLMKTAADRLGRHGVTHRGFGPSGMEIGQCPFDEIERRRRRIGLEVGARRLRSIVLLQAGVFHSNSTSGRFIVLGR